MIIEVLIGWIPLRMNYLDFKMIITAQKGTNCKANRINQCFSAKFAALFKDIILDVSRTLIL